MSRNTASQGSVGMILFIKLNKYISKYQNRKTINLSDIPHYWRKLWFRFASKFSNWIFFTANSDFVLHIAPLKKPLRFKENLARRKNYYPPLGYGFPPGENDNSNEHTIC